MDFGEQAKWISHYITWNATSRLLQCFPEVRLLKHIHTVHFPHFLLCALQSFVIHECDLVDSGGTSWHAKIDALLAMTPCQLKFHQPLKPESVKRYVRQVVVKQNYDRMLELPHSNPGQMAKLAKRVFDRGAGPP